jgi:predicted nucleic acid-binding protein
MGRVMEAGKKLRIYIDTSVISNLFSDDAPDQMEGSLKLWQECIAGRYDVFVSPVVLWEIGNCPEPKRSWLFEKINLIEFENLEETDEVRNLATEYVKGVLQEKQIADCFHIAYAVVHNCDVIVSWNFDHIVNDKTKGKVKIVNATNRYKEIEIVSPVELLKGVWR